MDRINHVKIVTPDPAAVDRFLREVVDIPEGWPLGAITGTSAGEPASPARDAEGNFTMDSIGAFRGSSSTFGGFITGSPESRQFQILEGAEPKGQRAGAYARQRPFKLAEARAPLRQLAHEQQRPLAADDLGCHANRTCLIDGHYRPYFTK